MRSYILILGLLSCSFNAFADWQTNAVRDPTGELSQFSLRATDQFPLFSVSCVSINTAAIDMVQLDRLTRNAIGVIRQIEIRVDRNQAMIFFPDQHKINIAYTYHPQLESGIETVTMVPANVSGEIQFAELVRQFIEGNRSVVRVITDTGDTRVEFSLMGFTKAYLATRTACLENDAA